MNFKKVNLIFGGVALVLLIGAGYLAWMETRPNSQVTDEVSVPETPASTGIVDDWKIYTNEEYGFELRHPADSTTEVLDARTIQISNSNPNDDSYIMAAGEYRLQILTYPAAELSCKREEIENPELVTVNGSTGYRGTGLGIGGKYFVLCLTRNGNTFHITAKESSEEGIIENAILDSFRFTK